MTGENWIEVIHWQNPVPRDQSGNGTRWFELALPQPVVTAYVKLDIESFTGTSQFFLDEVEILAFDQEAVREIEVFQCNLFEAEGPIAVDVLIVGGGTGGIPAAYQAAGAGFKVLVEPAH